MTKNTPFVITCRIAGYGALASLALSCYLFITSTTPAQYMLAALIAVLLLLLSVLVGFYFGLLANRSKQQHRFVEHGKRNVHYPAVAQFEQKVRLVERHNIDLYV